MKRLLLPLAAGLALAGCVTPDQWSEVPRGDGWYVSEPPVAWWGRDATSVDLFIGPLARHGRWDLHPRHGRVWLPAGVGPGWQPYTRGYWRADPRFGRLWVSAEPFGWATYHYGRWGHDPRFGWFWVPDVRFGPAWVDWRFGPSHLWWAPLPPPGWVGHGFGWQDRWWVHAPHGHIWRRDLYRHARPGRPPAPATPAPRPDPLVVERPEPEARPFDPDRHPRSSRPRPVPVAEGGEGVMAEPAWRGGRHPRATTEAPRPSRAEGWSRPAPAEGAVLPAPVRVEGSALPAAPRPAAAAPRVERPAPPPMPRREAPAPAPRASDLPRAHDD